MLGLARQRQARRGVHRPSLASLGRWPGHSDQFGTPRLLVELELGSVESVRQLVDDLVGRLISTVDGTNGETCSHRLHSSSRCNAESVGRPRSSRRELCSWCQSRSRSETATPPSTSLQEEEDMEAGRTSKPAGLLGRNLAA